MRQATPSLLLFALIFALPGGVSADLLVYEPFDYPPDDILTGNGGALGTTGTWYSHDTITDGLTKTQDWFVHEEGEISGVGLSGANPSVEPSGMHLWDGTVDNLQSAGGYVGLWGADDWDDPDGPNSGEPGRNLDANIGLDPSVTATFQPETTTWFSYVAVRGWDRNEETPNLTIGTDPTPDESRGASLINGGSGIGTGGGPPRDNRPHIYPMYFKDGNVHNLFGAWSGAWNDPAYTVPADSRLDWQELDGEGYFGAVNIVVGKIEWDADIGGQDIISVVRFLETDELTEEAFEDLIDFQPNLSSLNWPEANKPDLDQSQFDVLNIAGLKFFVDEIRIATTFEEVVPPAGPRPPCDTVCDGLTVDEIDEPDANIRATATASDGTGDAIRYRFTANDGLGNVVSVGPQDENVADFLLAPGQWTISVRVSDGISCAPPLAEDTCTAAPITVVERDGDGDGVPDAVDNCPETANDDQSDVDNDGVGDVCDNCPDDSNPDQADADEDGVGDVCEAAGARFVRGDANSDGIINLTDGIVILNFLFLGQAPPACMDAADVDDDGGARPSLTDAIRIFNWLFTGGLPPADPAPSAANYLPGDCGNDSTDDEMDCAVAAEDCE